MQVEFRVPRIEPRDDCTATVISVGVVPGQQVAAGDAVLELESEKSMLVVYANYAGTVTDVHIAPGDIVRANDLAYSLEQDEVTATVVRVLVECGTRLEPGQPVLLINIGGTEMEVPTEAGGIVREIYVAAGQAITGDQGLFEMEEDATDEDAAQENDEPA